MRSVEEEKDLNRRIQHDALDNVIETKVSPEFNEYIPYIRKHSYPDEEENEIQEEILNKKPKISGDIFNQENNLTFYEPTTEEILGEKVIYERNGIPVSATVKEILADEQDQKKYMIQYETDGRMEIRDYEDLIQHLHKMNKEGETYWSFDQILDHKKCNMKNSGGWQLLIKWSNGDETWQTLNSIRNDSPMDVAHYARDNDLLQVNEFLWCNKLLRKEKRYVRLS
jgi:hypothetical protein